MNLASSINFLLKDSDMKVLLTISLTLLVGLHLLCSLANNLFGTWNGYLEFYNKTPRYKKFHTQFRDLIVSTPSRYLSQYTGAETGFGFFAPNVLSSSVIVVEKDGKLNMPLFSNHENELRFNNLASSLTRNMLKRLEGHEKPLQLRKAVLGKYFTASDVDSAYNNLLLKNLAVPYLNTSGSHTARNVVSVKMLVYDYPSLAECAADKEPASEFIPLYVTNISLKNDRQ